MPIQVPCDFVSQTDVLEHTVIIIQMIALLLLYTSIYEGLKYLI
jgi:hypothetical protein